MNVSQVPVAPTLNPDLNMLSAADSESAEEVARAFESIFASLLIKEMRNTLSDGLFGSESSDVLGGLFDLHMGNAMTEGRGLGIKRQILSQLNNQPKED